MKRVYIQIIDPINGTCVNACHEYPDEYNRAVEATLRYYNLSADEDYEAMGETGHEIPGMPNYLLVHGLERDFQIGKHNCCRAIPTARHETDLMS